MSGCARLGAPEGTAGRRQSFALAGICRSLLALLIGHQNLRSSSLSKSVWRGVSLLVVHWCLALAL
jgi:hypothetical protein